jgi:triphosphoribosyl-dephospho-CoA synthetase
VSRPETAALSSGTMATITAAARTMYPYDASLDDVDARAMEQLDKAAREDFAAPGTIADAVMVVAWGQRRDLG